MLSKSKIALALVLGTASAAMAADKHPVDDQRSTVERQLPGANAYGYANSGEYANSGNTDPAVLDALKRQAAGDPRCRGGNCDPWGKGDVYD